MATLSLYSIQALAQVITGGSNADPPEKAISPYRTGPKIEQFFNALRVDFHVSGSESRVRAVEERLAKLAGEPGSSGKFIEIVEQALDPRHFKERPDLQGRAVACLNEQFEYDGWTLQEVNGRHRMIAFKGVPGQHRPRGVEGAPKNLIFASNGPKPEIVLADAINNDIQIVNNGEFCLVYERPISEAGLMWGDLVQWWAAIAHKDPDDREVQRSLYKRLLAAVPAASPPEKLLFETYYHTFKDLGPKLPSLLPQVYLHYDPRTVKELYGEKRLARQRMDFLLLFTNAIRVVIEVDGVQHYSDGGKPSPALYGEMVAADRQLRLAGYEVFRFGGAELQGEAGKAMVMGFFRDLFKKHGVSATE